MAQLVANVADAVNAEVVVDLGAGQGHLAQVMNLRMLVFFVNYLA